MATFDRPVNVSRGGGCVCDRGQFLAPSPCHTWTVSALVHEIAPSGSIFMVAASKLAGASSMPATL